VYVDSEKPIQGTNRVLCGPKNPRVINFNAIFADPTRGRLFLQNVHGAQLETQEPKKTRDEREKNVASAQ
jgi:hypothetical protein